MLEQAQKLAVDLMLANRLHLHHPPMVLSSTSADVTFDQATGSWGTITHIGIWDALTTGNLLYHTELTCKQAAATGDTFKTCIW